MSKLNFGRTYWCDWLSSNFEELFNGKGILFSFIEVDDLASPNFEVPQQIGKYYKSLDNTYKNEFSLGLIDCILKLKRIEINKNIFISLIQLSMEIDCFDIIESEFFEKVIFKGKNAILMSESSNESELFLVSLQCIEYFSPYGKGERIAYLCEKAIKSKWCSSKLIYRIFLILCRARPEKLFENWIIVRHKHIEFIKGENLSFTDLLPQKAILNQLKDLIHISDIPKFQFKLINQRDFYIEDEWLVWLMIGNSKNYCHVKIENRKQIFISKSSEAIEKYPLIIEDKSCASGAFYAEINKIAPLQTSFKLTDTAYGNQLQFEFLVKILNLETHTPRSIAISNKELSAISNESVSNTHDGKLML